MTLGEFISTRPPEEQTYLLDLVARNKAHAERLTASPVLGRAEDVAAGAVAGFGNALKGVATSPLAVANAFGADFTSPRTPLIGPGGNFASDPSLGLGVGPWYGTGSVLGFAASFLTGAGELKAGTTLLSKAAVGAANFAAGTALRSQGDLGERAMTGLESAPLGAAFGLAHVDRAAGQPLLNYIFKQSVRSGVAGAVIPGSSPIDATGIPAVDNGLFNAFFAAATSARAREPRVPGRERVVDATRATADVIATTRMNASDMQRSVDEQATLEAAARASFPDQPTLGTGGANLFSEVQGTQRPLFGDVTPTPLIPAEPLRVGPDGQPIEPYPAHRAATVPGTLDRRTTEATPVAPD